MAKLLVLGAGRMGSALAAGLLRAGWARPNEIVMVDRDGETRRRLAERYPDLAVEDEPRPADAMLVAVKPQDAEAACRAVPRDGYGRVLSVVAGVPLEKMESWLWPGLPVLRAMPNTPALVGAGASAVAGGRAAGEEDLAWAEAVLSSVGVVVRLPERLIDVATGLSGSGPAYLFLVAEALVEAGVLGGLSREVSRVLASQTILGAGRMLVETGESAEVLRAAVTSPGGTTAAGLRALENRSVRAAMIDAVDAASRRARQIGDS
ncbi:MAG: proC [Acidimicrobiaceae bacterium]|nr:proC [Acidimicrobiaceae bacterium]